MTLDCFTTLEIVIDFAIHQLLGPLISTTHLTLMYIRPSVHAYLKEDVRKLVIPYKILVLIFND